MIIPNGHYVLVKPVDVSETDETYKKVKAIGLELPEDLMRRENQATNIGVLVGIGPDAWKAFGSEEPWAKEGDRVYYPKHTGNRLVDPDTGIEYLLMTDERIIANYEKVENNE